MERQEVLGVDVGGVILDALRYRGTDLDFESDNYLETPEVENAIDSIALLNKGRFADRVHIVTRYHIQNGPARVIEWLEHKDFFQRTDIPRGRYHPCAERHEKAPIARELGITHFIDDRAEVLSHMIGQVEHLYLFKSPDANKPEFQIFLLRFKKVESWGEMLDELAQQSICR